LVVNLGTALANYFKRDVTVVDCNITTSHLALHLGMYYSPVTLNKVLRDESPIQEAIYEHFSGLKVIPAALSVRELEGLDMIKLKEKLNELTNLSEIVLLDSAPGLGREAISTLRSGDEVLYITTPYVPSLMDIIRTQEVVSELGIKSIGIVLNMVRNEKHELTNSEIEHLTGLPVIAKIPFDKNIPRSVAVKTPIVLLNPRSKASREFLKLAAFLIGETYKESFFSRFLGFIFR